MYGVYFICFAVPAGFLCRADSSLYLPPPSPVLLSFYYPALTVFGQNGGGGGYVNMWGCLGCRSGERGGGSKHVLFFRLIVCAFCFYFILSNIVIVLLFCV